MASDKYGNPKPTPGLRLEVSTASHPEFDAPLQAIVFSQTGQLVQRADVVDGVVTLKVPQGNAAKARIFLAPVTEELAAIEPTPELLERLGAYEPILRPGHGAELRTRISIPIGVLTQWPWCFCVVRGKVVRASDGLPVCNARVHICEVDRMPPIIKDLPPEEIFKLRDDLLRELYRPFPFPEPGPDPDPYHRSLFRLQESAIETHHTDSAPLMKPAAPAPPPLERSLSAKLESRSARVVADAMAANWQIIYPYFCHWPHWWWLLTCDEVAVRTTDPNGRFEAVVPYLCAGDHPDIYFWVEYDFGTGFETVHEPPMACWTYWDLACGTEVTIRVADPRVPACGVEPELPGKQVWIVSVGREVSIAEIQTNTAPPGMEGREAGTNFAFGGKIEPRAWFSSGALLGSNITHYLWSRRKVGSPGWTPLLRQVIRHYTTQGGAAPVVVLGPEPAGVNAGRFDIREKDPPGTWADREWLVADEREDLASAHFETSAPPANPSAHCGVADPDAGKYELKLELFDSLGQRVLWDNADGTPHVEMRHTTSSAPFGVATVNTMVSDDYHRIRNAAGRTTAFRMVLHVDNSRCGADIPAVSGTNVTVEPECGVVTLNGPNPTLDVGFMAGRPGGLATFGFSTIRGLGTPIHVASAAGSVGAANVNGFVHSGICQFNRSPLPVDAFLAPPGYPSCPQGAFAETLHVAASTQDGYGRLNGLDAYDVVAFMLTRPCPPCPPLPAAAAGADPH